MRGFDHLLLLLSNGPYGFLGEDAVRGAVPDRLALHQDGLPLEMRDMDLDVVPRGAPPFAMSKVFRIIGAAGLDIGQPIGLDLRVTRSVGVVYPERVSRDFTLKLDIPGRYVIASGDDQKGWRPIWRARAGEITVLLLALAGLALVLAGASLAVPAMPAAAGAPLPARPQPSAARLAASLAPLVTRLRTLRIVRPLYLVFTLVFIGWYAQAQLSIVNLVALLDAARAGRSWAFFLFDPLSTLLWLFVLASLFVWGRGTFCGWLCPYGALQELAALAGRLARVPVIRLRSAWDARLKWLKYAVLAAIVLASLYSAALTDALVEVEPFKTAITLVFIRSWPFAAYAAALVVLGIFINKFFCRYLCPLGAALALAGRLRRWDWIGRRAECGTPCQTCRYRCSYQAIDSAGRVHYDECFQCMDCVAIFESDTECAPRLLAAKGRRTITIKELAPRKGSDR